MHPDRKRPLHHPYDKAYKSLLSSRSLFAELLQNFVPSEWARQIAGEDLLRVDKSYILSDYKEKESDLVYRACIRGQEFYFYLLLEFQSRVDFEMPHRLLTYMTEIWRDVSLNAPPAEVRRKSYRLPAIVPIVLYNGSSAWTAARSFREMLGGEQHFGEELLNFRYVLLDVKRLDERKLQEMDNLMGLIFLVEQHPGAESFTAQLKKSSRMLQTLSPELFRLFKSWFKLINPKETEQIGHILDEFNDPKGVDSMISNLTKALRDEYYEMRRKGLEEGKTQGKAEGERAARQEIARNLLAEGMSAEQTMRLSGLTREEIDRLST